MFVRPWIAAWAIGLVSFAAAQAGTLTLTNRSTAPITCQVGTKTLTVPASGNYAVAPQDGPIDSVTCGALVTRAMNITSDGPNGFLVLTGAQTRVLNAALYPYIPNLLQSNFDVLVNHVIAAYQQQNPDVLLAVQLNENTDIYDFDNLKVLLGAGGLDVVEIDTLYLDFLRRSSLINQVAAPPHPTLPVALAASTINSQLWGVPSWLCMDFDYSLSEEIKSVSSLSGLKTFLEATPSAETQLVADYNGSWRMVSIYINAYVQQFTLASLSSAKTMPPNQFAIANLVSLMTTCNGPRVNNCTNGVYDGQTTAPTEREFAAGLAFSLMDFSEQSFYVRAYGQAAPLYIVPGVWGPQPQPLLFSDTYVSNRASCAAAPCATDAAAFTALMTSTDMKTYIVKSTDLGTGTPWRTLLVATSDFYQQPEILSNPLYQQYTTVFNSAAPFPNDFTPEQQAEIGAGVCAALTGAMPQYKC